MADTETRLRDLVAEHLGLVQEPHRITPDATFDSLGADSLDSVELSMAVEEEFRIALTDDEADEAFGVEKTFGDALKAVDAKLAARANA